MCGRFVLKATPEEVADYLDLVGLDDFPARFNIAPTQPVLVIVEGAGQQPGSNLPNRQAMLVRWGFIPGWVKDPKTFPLIINARAETAIGKASFRAAMRHRRILVPTSGFYEWHRPSKESGEPLQAYWIRPKNGGIVCFGGLMETYMSKDGSELDTGCILTVGANRSIAQIHDRMPVILNPAAYDEWLDTDIKGNDAKALLRSQHLNDNLEFHRVGRGVNSSRYDGTDTKKPIINSQ